MTDQSRALICAVTGPIILITVGSLFALDKFTAYPFRQTWPILIIVIGMLKLFGGGRRRKYGWAAGQGAPGPGYQTPPANGGNYTGQTPPGPAPRVRQ